MGMLGGKLSGSHTTLNKLAGLVVKHLDPLPSVTKISLGMLTNRAGKMGQAPRSVKIIEESGCILVRCTQNASISEMRVYTNDREATIKSLAKFVKDNGWDLRFRRLPK